LARPIAKDHDAKRSHILRVAAELFATEGFDRASMAQLAQACGISKANIYHYYDSKDALLFDILDSYLSGLRDRICSLDLIGPPGEQLHMLIRDILLAYKGSDHEHRVQITGIDRLPDAQRTRLRAYQRDMVHRLSDVLTDVSPALARDKVHLRHTTMSIFGMLNWYYMWNTGAGTAAREAYARHVTDLTLRGIAGD
jgi:AcrR family transcriptional regulator